MQEPTMGCTSAGTAAGISDGKRMASSVRCVRCSVALAAGEVCVVSVVGGPTARARRGTVLAPSGAGEGSRRPEMLPLFSVSLSNAGGEMKRGAGNLVVDESSVRRLDGESSSEA